MGDRGAGRNFGKGERLNRKSHQKSLVYFGHLATFDRFPKRRSQKGEGHGTMPSCHTSGGGVNGVGLKY